MSMTDKITILLITADPSDATRLRLGEELREIQQKLQLGRNRDHFLLEMRPSVRPGDLTQAIVDTKPQIVHFSGHGTRTGELRLQNNLGKTHSVSPDALASLFELVADQVHCVILNACYSEAQAKAIAQHIDYVIGMEGAIGDEAAITFSVGFYKALGAGYTVEEAYKFGLVELKLMEIPGHLIPTLRRKETGQSTRDEEFGLKRKPGDLEIRIAVPHGFTMDSPNRLSDFHEWLNNPSGADSNATEHPIEGEVVPHGLGAVVDIRIRTDKWYPQSRCSIQDDGTFSGTVWLHRSRPSAVFRFDVLDRDGSLLKRFDVKVS